MATSINDLRRWLKQGKDKKASHMMIICDTFDWKEYPIYVMPTQIAKDIYNSFHMKNEQKVMEVYNLFKDIDIQLNKYRSMEF